jgi:hypothetical protein
MPSRGDAGCFTFGVAGIKKGRIGQPDADEAVFFEFNRFQNCLNVEPDPEGPLLFTTPKSLLDDFWNDVDNWRP